jgi:hypothetical protein
MCLVWKSGVEGEVLIMVFAKSNVLEVNLTELGGKVDAPQDGTPKSVKPGSGKVYWNSDNFTNFLTLTLNTAPGDPRRYSLLIGPSGNGPKGVTRNFTLFLAGSEYAFVIPE